MISKNALNAFFIFSTKKHFLQKGKNGMV